MILTMYWKGKMDIIVLVLCLSLVAMDIIQSVDAKVRKHYIVLCLLLASLDFYLRIIYFDT